MTVILSGLAVAGCGGSSSGHQQQQGNQPCGTVTGSVNGNIIDSGGGSCEVTWQTANLGTMGYAIGLARSLDSDNMSFSSLTIEFAAATPAMVSTITLADTTAPSAVQLYQGSTQDEPLVAEKAANVMVGSASISITSIEPSDGISSIVHGTLTAHLGPPPGAQYSGNADVDMTF